MPAIVSSDLQTRGAPVLMLIVTTAVLYLAQVVLIPLAVAVLFTFVLAPAVRRLERWRLGRIPSTLAVVLLAFSAVGSIGYLAVSQALQVAGSLPQYKDNIRAKIQDVRGSPEGNLGKASEALKDLQSELTQETPDQERRDQRPDGQRPIPVEIEPPRASLWQFIQEVAGPLFAPLGMAGAVILFTILMLLNREDLRDRIIRVVGRGRINVTTQALEEAGQRVSRYLTAQLMVNASYGVPVGVALHFLGLPNALLWGLLATLLRFIPYVGAWIAAAMPIALAFAIDDGWNLVLWTLAVFLALELVSNNIVEPWLYGASTGLSTIAIMVAVIFWTWLWGAVGLLLATPLTVCLSVMGRYIPQLQFLNILLGDEPVLMPEARFYQRLLAQDQEDATELAEQYVQEHSTVAFFDDVLLPALNLAEEDRHRDALDERRQRFTYETMKRITEDLTEATADQRASAGGPRTSVVIVAVRDDADDLAANILARLLEPDLFDVHVLSHTLPPAEVIRQVEEITAPVLVVSAVPPYALMHAAFVAKRLRRHFPSAQLIAALWQRDQPGPKTRQRLTAAGINETVTTMKEATSVLRQRALPIEGEMQAPILPADEEERLQALHALRLLDTEPDEAFDRITRDLSRIFDVPIALFTLIDRNRQWWKSQVGLPPKLAEDRSTTRDVSICGHVVAGGRMLVVEDLLRDERFANNPLVRSTGMRFYAGAPLRTEDGHVVGSLCLIDRRPRRLDERERQLLQLIADLVMADVQRRAHQAQAAERELEPAH